MKRLALAGVAAAALLAPGLARAELLPGSAGSPDEVALATRSVDGVWSAQPLTGLPGASPFLVGLEVAADGTTVLLAEDRASRWLALAERSASGAWSVRVVAAAPKGGLLGFGGLALDGLSWYRTATAPVARVELSATASGASFALTGRVTGASSGSVELWRETQAGSELVSSLPLAADGTFAATDLPPVRPLVYRAVYRDPASGLPVASLWRTILGA